MTATQTHRNATYRDIEGFVASREPFQGNSMSAQLDADGTYRVFSYATEIATAKGSDVWISPNRWGVTTGRHINICKRGL
jgi:hypothetical protein